jgi:hypothetical protein
MKYVHVHSGAEREAEPGALHYPWVAPERQHVNTRLERAREAARGMVADALAAADEPPKAKRGPGRPPKAKDDSHA